MKILSSVILFSFLISKAHAAQTSVSVEDMMSVNLVLLDMANERIDNLKPKLPCKDGVIVEIKKPEEKECDCKFKGLIGKIESQEFSFNSGNDNFLHGTLNLYAPSLRQYDGNDLGRTFNTGIDYSLLGSEGRLKLNLDSTGFGKYTTVNGAWRDNVGDHYLVFRELDTLSVKYDKFLKKTDDKKIFGSVEFKLENETDDGHISRDIQNSWHHAFTYDNGKHPRYYNYVQENEDQTTVKILAGGGIDLEKTLAGITCTETLSGKAGLSYNSKLDYVYSARTETKLKATAIPYLVVSLWGEISRDFRGLSKEGGVEISFPMKIKRVTIKPYIGVEKHISPLDKSYGTPSGNPYEIYNTIGMRVNW